MKGKTPRLRITPLDAGDVEDLHAALDHPAVGDYIGGPDVTTVAALRERVERLLRGPGPGSAASAWLNFVVRRDDRVIGRLQATTYDDWAEVAWVIGSPFWGQGLGREAATWLVEHLEVDLGLRDIWATAHPGNAASIAILRGLGFTEKSLPARRQPASFDAGDFVFARQTVQSRG